MLLLLALVCHFGDNYYFSKVLINILINIYLKLVVRFILWPLAMYVQRYVVPTFESVLHAVLWTAYVISTVRLGNQVSEGHILLPCY